MIKNPILIIDEGMLENCDNIRPFRDLPIDLKSYSGVRCIVRTPERPVEKSIWKRFKDFIKNR